MHTDTIEPFMAVTKEMELRFSFGYTPAEFAATLARLADGVPGAELLVTVHGRPGRCTRRLRDAAHPGRARQDPGEAVTWPAPTTTVHRPMPAPTVTRPPRHTETTWRDDDHDDH